MNGNIPQISLRQDTWQNWEKWKERNEQKVRQQQASNLSCNRHYEVLIRELKKNTVTDAQLFTCHTIGMQCNKVLWGGQLFGVPRVDQLLVKRFCDSFLREDWFPTLPQIPSIVPCVVWCIFTVFMLSHLFTVEVEAVSRERCNIWPSLAMISVYCKCYY